MDRIILVTGASRGLGLAMVQHFIEQGDRVFGVARSASDFSHPNYVHTELDITDQDAVADFFRQFRRHTNQLDVLINNAGMASMNAFAITPAATVGKMFELNVHGTARFCQKALGLLKRSPHPRIINLTTVAVPLLLEGEAIYAASKSAVETLTKILAKEYGHFGVTCNAVGPSPIDTALIKGVPQDKINQLVHQHQAIKKKAEPADVLNVIDFFVQPQSDMISGQIIYLGGVTA